MCCNHEGVGLWVCACTPYVRACVRACACACACASVCVCVLAVAVLRFTLSQNSSNRGAVSDFASVFVC